MKKRFMLVIDELSKAEEEMILEYCRTNNFGWWHWFENFWLLYTKDMSVSSEQLRNEFNNLFRQNKHLIIMEIADTHKNAWAGYGIPEKFEWLHDRWKED